MPTLRKTAVVHFELPSSAALESLPLTRERSFGVYLRVDGQNYPALPFRSPINDEVWREFTRLLREASTKRERESGYHAAEFIRSLGRDLWSALSATSPRLREFLSEAGVPRRLVVESTRPELHVLPWGALYDTEGRFLAAGDLSIVQCWEHFSEEARPSGPTLNLVSVLGAGTNKSTSSALRDLPAEIARDAAGPADILHLEEHGDAASGSVGDTAATTLARRYSASTLALLWSCYSGAANSWGESPALSLHRAGAGLVLSFQAELHVHDARSLAEEFYADVFGPLASRDPESALVRLRAKKFDGEYEFANWASMVVFLRSPCDLSAMPLNGSRVPAARWTSDEDPAPWTAIREALAVLTPGRIHSVPAQAGWSKRKLPRQLFRSWRGNVICLQGRGEPIADSVLRDLHLPRPPRLLEPAARLAWFFAQMERYGSPLIVWEDAGPQHEEFLRLLKPPASLAFLLLHAAEAAAPPSLRELVDRSHLEAARALAAALPEDAGDELWTDAYVAFARSEMEGPAARAIGMLRSASERALLRANFVSRFGREPDAAAPYGSCVEQRNAREMHLREAALLAVEEGSLFNAARARHQLAYLLASEGQGAAAEELYRRAMTELERDTAKGPLWDLAMSSVLRDWAELLSCRRERTSEASALLRRAMLIQALQSPTSGLPYSLCTAARISQTNGDRAAATEQAVEAANRFEAAGNWRGWAAALEVLLEGLADAAEPQRVLAVVQLAVCKLQGARVSSGYRAQIDCVLAAQGARAHWAIGDLPAALASAKQALGGGTETTLAPRLRSAIEQLLCFLTPGSLPGRDA